MYILYYINTDLNTKKPFCQCECGCNWVTNHTYLSFLGDPIAPTDTHARGDSGGSQVTRGLLDFPWPMLSPFFLGKNIFS